MVGNGFDMFNFSKVERVGIIILSLFIVVLLTIRLTINFITPENYDYTRLSQIIDSLEANKKTTFEDYPREEFEKFDHKENSSSNLHPFAFDPNLVNHENWVKMGLSAKKATVIENYKAKGGRFYEPKDLKKMYCITQSEFQQLEPYIFITQGEKTNLNHYRKDEMVLIELNSIDETGIQIVKGIGPSFAKRIIKYRDMLGGFADVNQLKEVYGLDSIMFEKVACSFYVSTDSLKKIDINKADYKTFLKHPYFNKKLIYSINHYKSIHGRFKSSSDLMKVEGVNDSVYLKINPYLGGYN